MVGNGTLGGGTVKPSGLFLIGGRNSSNRKEVPGNPNRGRKYGEESRLDAQFGSNGSHPVGSEVVKDPIRRGRFKKLAHGLSKAVVGFFEKRHDVVRDIGGPLGMIRKAMDFG